MQIRASISKNSILGNIFASMSGTVIIIVSVPIFAWSRITINIFIEFQIEYLILIYANYSVHYRKS